MCGRRRDLQRATALLHINRLQPSLPSRCASVWNIPCSEPRKQQIPDCVHGHRAQEARSEQQCFHSTPSQVSQLLLLA